MTGLLFSCFVSILNKDVIEELKDQAEEMQETYPDAIGWIYVPNTNTNYPIMQGEDNDFYLTHGTDGRSLKCGWITAALRERKFFSFAEVQEAVAERLEFINTKPFQKRPGCRSFWTN